jgi:hypothetical protein
MVNIRAEKEKMITAKSIIVKFCLLSIYKILLSRTEHILTHRAVLVNSFVHTLFLAIEAILAVNSMT